MGGAILRSEGVRVIALILAIIAFLTQCYDINDPVYGPPPPPPQEIYVVTAYTAGDRYTPSHGVTASGERVKSGVTVSCPPELPLGTRIRIEDVGTRICQDRGGAIKGRRLDVYMTSIAEAKTFGRRELAVTIINEEETIE